MRNHVVTVEVNIAQEKVTVLHMAKCAEHVANKIILPNNAKARAKLTKWVKT